MTVTMRHEPYELAAGLRAVVDAVRIAPDATTARVADTHNLAEDTSRHLCGALADALYETFHAGLRLPQVRPRTWRDPDLERRFAQVVPHCSTPVTAVWAGPSGPDGFVAEIGGVRVDVPASRLTAGTQRPGDHVTLRWPAANRAVSPGFYFVTGSSGPPRSRPLTRLYIHLTTPEDAPNVLGTVLRELERTGLPYQAKVASTEHQYPRRDAMVVYLGGEAGPAVDAVAGSVRGLRATGTSTSAFAHLLGPGVAVAHEPDDPRPGMRGLSFGEHRSRVLAEALVEHALRPEDENPYGMVARHCAQAGIDSHNPAFNSHA
ncbi:T3SS effector HopA1 family protein [Streptomyces monashensis]|uniref:T3SS effector HopA1 family protein n=1 Tax=Streptomyces monashensis TaxID=1678012 RepID=UPI0033E58CE8